MGYDIPDKRIQIPSALFFDGVAGEEAAERGRVVAVIVVNKVEFGVVNFGRPLEGLRDVAGSGDRAERSVGIRRSDVVGGAEDFADVFRKVVAIGEPRAVLLNRKRTRRITNDNPLHIKTNNQFHSKKI